MKAWQLLRFRYGRGGGVGRGLGVVWGLGVGVGLGVAVGDGVDVAVGVAVGVAVAVAVGVAVAVAVGVAVAVAVGVAVAVAVGVGVGVEPAVIVKFESEISKKMLSTASTFTLAVVVATLGIVSASEPSLGVLAERTVGKVVPPSVDNDILTAAQVTGAPVVPATSHIIVWVEPPAHDTFVLGDVTWKGPEVLLTVTVISVNWV